MTSFPNSPLDNQGRDAAFVNGKSMALYMSLWKVNKAVIYQTNVIFGQAYREVNKGQHVSKVTVQKWLRL